MVRLVVSRDESGLVLEATQPRLERDVVLRLVAGAGPGYLEHLGEAMGRLTELRHAAIPRPLAVGMSEWGPYAAFAPRPGRPLRRMAASRRTTALRDAEAALETLHNAGLAHGALDADAIRIDPQGNAVLLHAGTAGAIFGAPLAAQQDREAIEGLSARPSRRLLAPLLAGGALAAIGFAAWIALPRAAEGGGSLPPPPEGTTLLGSDLQNQAASVGCDGLEPTPSTVDCSVVRTRGKGVTEIPADGVIRAWAVSGATGEVSLQIFRRRGDLFIDAGTSPIERSAGTSPQQFDSQIPVREGDLVGLLVQIGSGFGVEGAAGGRTAIYSGSLDRDVTEPDSDTPATVNLPLALRVALDPGGSPDLPRLTTGRKAAALADGSLLESLLVSSPRGGEARDATVVRTGEGMALDSFDGKRRVARIAIPDADPDGTLVRFGYWGEEPNGVELSWSNRDGSTVFHQYRVGQASIRLAN